MASRQKAVIRVVVGLASIVLIVVMCYRLYNLTNPEKDKDIVKSKSSETDKDIVKSKNTETDKDIVKSKNLETDKDIVKSKSSETDKDIVKSKNLETDKDIVKSKSSETDKDIVKSKSSEKEVKNGTEAKNESKEVKNETEAKKENINLSDFLHTKLPNGLNVVIKHDEELESKDKVGLLVKVGFLDVPKGKDLLIDLTEGILWYKISLEYNKGQKQLINSYHMIDKRITMYNFEVEKENLKELLDIMSSCIKNLSFKKTDELTILIDSVRRLNNTFKPYNITPLLDFILDSLAEERTIEYKTISKDQSSMSEPTEEEMDNFFRYFHTPPNMTLVVHTKNKIEVIHKWIVESFGSIKKDKNVEMKFEKKYPNLPKLPMEMGNKADVTIPSIFPENIGDSLFSTVIPLEEYDDDSDDGDITELTIMIPLPAVIEQRQTGIIRFINSYIMKKFSKLLQDEYDGKYGSFSNFSFFQDHSIIIITIDSECKNDKSIISLRFDLKECLKKAAEEIRKLIKDNYTILRDYCIEKIEKNRRKGRSNYNIDEIMEYYYYYPITDIFNHEYLLNGYNPKLLDDILEELINDKKWVFLYMSKDIDLGTLKGDMKETESGIQYKVSPFSSLQNG